MVTYLAELIRKAPQHADFKKAAAAAKKALKDRSK